jgi:hypothetical protein
MSLQAATGAIRLSLLPVSRSLLARNTPNRMAARSVFYTQRKRPSTPEENLTLLVGVGALASAIAVVRRLYYCNGRKTR